MPQKTPTYKLEYLKRGAPYSAATDYRRFVTVDYNMNSYVGVVGVGIISGWDVEHMLDLIVQVIPGNGIIDGYTAESPYTIKQRSEMVTGDREVEVMPDASGIPEPNLTALERATYISVIQAYDPTYDPSGAIENAYVKTSIPVELTLSNNADNYIYASIISATPYPKADDYPPSAGDPPSRGDYDTYAEYRVAFDEWQAQIDAIHNYDWRDNSANHYTAVEFTVSSIYSKTPSKILIGKVITRSGNVSTIDTSLVDSLDNMQSEIERYTIDYLVKHIHGGNKVYDPPKIKLETDIRPTVLEDYDLNTGHAVYQVLNTFETSLTLGHKHTYSVDVNGNGNTIRQLGSTDMHFHKIEDYILQSPNYSSTAFVEDHTHTIESNLINLWDETSSYNVYRNGELYADRNTPSVSIDITKGEITFNSGINAGYSTFTVSFSVFGKDFTYTGKAVTAYQFMLKMLNEFYKSDIGITLNSIQDLLDAENAGIYYRPSDDPFVFWTPIPASGLLTPYSIETPLLGLITVQTLSEANYTLDSINGFADLKTQSEIADTLLTSADDTFTYVSSAANDITIIIIKKGYVDEIEIEILGNVEVTGTLPVENIVYINAKKILLGEFIPEVIPFISHIGRFLEDTDPFKYSLISNDGYRCQVAPSATDNTLGHYHKLLLDQKGVGGSTSLYVGEEAVYYGTGNAGDEYFISHHHSVDEYVLDSVTGPQGLIDWQTDVTGINVSSETHTHEIVFPVSGNNKIVYSIKEDIDGHIYTGTSDGFMMIPSYPTYSFVYNGHQYYEYGYNLWDMIVTTKAKYEEDNDVPFYLTESNFNSQIAELTVLDSTLLSQDGDSAIIEGDFIANRTQDTLVIFRISSFKIPKFRSSEIKKDYEVTSEEEIVKVLGYGYEGTGVSQQAYLNVQASRDFTNTPVWSIELKEVVANENIFISSSSSSVDSSSSSSIDSSSSSSSNANSSSSSSSSKSSSSSSSSSINSSDSSSSSSTDSSSSNSSSSSSSVDLSSSSSTSSEGNTSESSSSSMSSSSSSKDSSSSSSSRDSSSSSSSSSIDSSSSSSFGEGASGYTEIFVVGSDLIGRNRALSTDLNGEHWENIQRPFAVGSVREVVVASNGDYWFATSNGILVSRFYNDGSALELVDLPGANPDVKNVLEGEKDVMYCSSASGIFKTEDDGKSWTKKLDVVGGFKQVIRDYTIDKTNLYVGHYHRLNVDGQGNGYTGSSIGSGVSHVHSVNTWNITEVLGHTHTLVVTLYAVDSTNIIWKSDNNGETWVEYGSISSDDRSAIFAAFGSLYYSDRESLYKSNDGEDWVEALDKRVNSFSWNYNLSGFFVGGDSIIYKTLNGTNFTSIYAFEGEPMPVLVDGGTKTYFGYAYRNSSQVFHFRESPDIDSELLSYVDFGRWFATQGTWSTNALYDVYINDRRVLSTKFNEDNRDTFGYDFEVEPENGLINFSAETTLSVPIKAGDMFATFTNADMFAPGNWVIIKSETTRADIISPTPPPSDASDTQVRQFNSDMDAYNDKLWAIDNMSTYAQIASISGNDVVFKNAFTLNIPVTIGQGNDVSLFGEPIKINKLPLLNGDSSINLNIYDGLLTNVGDLTHEQVEDGLSAYSDGRPYQFNDSYLSNLLQLTQAVRFVYPDINSEFKNNLFYDFRYAWTSTDPLYPNINDYIDVLTSEIYSQSTFDSLFTKFGAKSINKMFIGYENFIGNIYVGTDVGIFWAKLDDNYEANWFYTTQMTEVVYDITVLGDTLLVATITGVYFTYDMETWRAYVTPFSGNPTYVFGNRWPSGDASISVAAHIATFESDRFSSSSQSDGEAINATEFEKGYITASSGTPYSVLKENRNIEISGAGDKNGFYNIESIGDGGMGYGSKLTVSRPFTGADETISGVSMVMATWWNQWDGDFNLYDEDITSTMFIGGRNFIEYSVNHTADNTRGDWAWIEAIVSESDFSAKEFLPLPIGSIIALANGNDILNTKNFLLRSVDIGRNWDAMRTFEAVNGKIISYVITDQNNVELTVEYPSGYLAVDGLLTRNIIKVYNSAGSIVYSGYVVWNKEWFGTQKLMTYSNDVEQSLISGDYTFTVFPLELTTAQIKSDSSILFGTNMGLYSDKGTLIGGGTIEGEILSPRINATIGRIDLSGSIIRIISNSEEKGSTTLTALFEDIVRAGELIGKSFYITDENPVKKYTIIGNSSVFNGEVSIEIEGNIAGAYYKGKAIKVVGSQSRIYVTFDQKVSIGEFDGGKLYVVTDENKNQGTQYDVFHNTESYIDINTSLVPFSTQVTANNENNLTNGQKVSPIDASGLLEIWVALDGVELRDNALQGLTLSLTSLNSPAASLSKITIYSNSNNSLKFEPEQFDSLGVPLPLVFNQDNFEVVGLRFEAVSDFNDKETTVESGHYHNTEMENKYVNGVIDAFVDEDASYIEFSVTDTNGFSDEIVQRQADLFKGAKIVFTNIDAFYLKYESEVDSITATTIRVRVKSAGNWDTLAYNPYYISTGWQWEIDATNYGYTLGTIYKDFVSLNSKITNDVDRGLTVVQVENTNGMVIGDRIRLQDDTLSFEINYIETVDDATHFTMRNGASRTYFKTRNPEVRVLVQSFSNEHTHQIRNNEVQLLTIDAYLNRGYPSNHTHRVVPYISSITSILSRGGQDIVCGSDSKVYISHSPWEEMIDLNEFLDGVEPLTGISTAIMENDQILAGANNGNIFVEGGNGATIVRLEKPIVINNSSSSSSSSSVSSSSFSSSSSSSSSLDSSSSSSSSSPSSSSSSSS